MDNISICSICLGPIYNFICADCLFKQIKRWLRENASYLILEVEKAHQNLIKTFHTTDSKQFCIHCRKTNGNVFCPFCYTKYIYLHLKEFDERAAEKMVSVFNFDFEGTGMYSDFHPEPIGYEEEKTEEGICEYCDNLSDSLKNVNGLYVCESCEELVKDKPIPV